MADARAQRLLPEAPAIVVEGWVIGHAADGDSFQLFDGRHELEIEYSGAAGCARSDIKIGAVLRVEASQSDRAILARNIELLAAAAAPRFDAAVPDDGPDSPRSRYRYLEFRNPAFQQVFRLRHRIWLEISNLLDARGYLHVETPLLATQSETGANEFVVTSTRDAHLRYALPQSPQLFGHLLAIGGVTRYFQWSRCFRDEDSRANRQPEFTQLHVEAAFSDEAALIQLGEEIVRRCFELAGLDGGAAFEQLSFHEAQRRFGTDKPDLRIACGFTQLPCILVEPGRESQLFVCELPPGLDFTNEEIGQIGNLVARRRMQVTGYVGPEAQRHARFPMRVNADELAAALRAANTYVPGSSLLIAGEWAAHGKLSRDLYKWLIERPQRPPGYRPVWIREFPLFEEDAAQKGRLKAFSHPFTAPQDPAALAEAKRNHELLALKGRAFDLVLNGEEIGSGSMLIGDPDLLHEIFARMSLSKKEVRAMFGVVMDALACGAPPIGGFGLGIDRLLALMTGKDRIRDVIAFPKSRNGICPVFQKR
jgi:aspartyl-tRNA synthetase